MHLNTKVEYTHTLIIDKKAIDPTGKNIKPVAITNMTDYVSPDLKSEMEGYIESLNLLSASAQKGIDFSTGIC